MSLLEGEKVRMEQKKFMRDLSYLILSNNLNFNLIASWYAGWINKLKQTHKGTKEIKHPKKRGDIREKEMIEFLLKIIPFRYGITQGFAINSVSTISREQDILIYDKNISPIIIDENDCKYIPQYAIPVAIEVKSKITNAEIAKIILNCASIKKLRYDGGFDFEEKKSDNIFYAVFCYESGVTLNSIIKKIGEYNENVPKTLQIDMIYVLGKGLICKPSKYGITTMTQDMFDCEEEYVEINKMTCPKIFDKHIKEFGVDPFLFIFFIYSIIEKCERLQVKNTSHLATMFRHMIYEQDIINKNDEDIIMQIKKDVIMIKDELVECIKFESIKIVCDSCKENNILILKKDYDSVAEKGIKIQSFPFICVDETASEFNCPKCGHKNIFCIENAPREEAVICGERFRYPAYKCQAKV